MDRVAGQRLAQRPQQRDGAGHRGLVVQVGPELAGRAVEFRAVLGQQRLVRGDHRLAALHRVQQQRPGRLDAADHLDHDVHVRAGDQRVRVGGEQGRSIPAARGCPTRRTAMPASSSRAPMRRARSSACSRSSRATSDPTTPQPSRATFSVGRAASESEAVESRSSDVQAEEVVHGLAAEDYGRAGAAPRPPRPGAGRGCSCWRGTGSRRRWRRRPAGRRWPGRTAARRAGPRCRRSRSAGRPPGTASAGPRTRGRPARQV